VVFTGELEEHSKWAALAAADLFVMPSDFENFGNAIVEAMCCGIPVITTTGTPWEELRAAGAGWWVPPTVADLTRALGDALSLPEDQRQAMGRRALPIAERFRPERIAADLIHVYEWLFGREERPKCVVL
jgi:glycosyltransferase involved in cell wall biosynthesis